MQEIVKNFTLIHIDAPGQEEGAAAYPAGYAIICVFVALKWPWSFLSEMETILCGRLKTNLSQKYLIFPSPSFPVSNTLLSEGLKKKSGPLSLCTSFHSFLLRTSPAFVLLCVIIFRSSGGFLMQLSSRHLRCDRWLPLVILGNGSLFSWFSRQHETIRKKAEVIVVICNSYKQGLVSKALFSRVNTC